MATNEVSGFLKYKDEEGNLNLLLPITTKDNIDGLDEIEQDLLETVKFTPQALTDEQKAQAQANIGLNELGQELVAYASEMVVVVDPETMTTNYSSTEIKNAVDMGRTVVAEYDGVRYSLFISTGVSQIFHVAFVANLDGYAARNTTLSVLDNTATIEIMDAASGSGGSGVFIVEVDASTMTASHSASEIIAAADEGKLVYGKDILGALLTAMVPYCGIYRSDEDPVRVFFSTRTDVNEKYGLSNRIFIVAEDKSVTTEYCDVNPAHTEGAVAVGQVLAVKNVDSANRAIEWEAVDMPSGEESELFVITVDEASMTASHNPSEILAAADLGKMPVLRIYQANDSGYHFTTYCVLDGNILFYQTLPHVYAGYAATISMVVQINSDKSVSLGSMESAVVPNPTESDSGKVLSVDDSGNPVWSEAGGSGESDVFLVNIDPGTMTASHSASEIKTVVDAGKVAIAIMAGIPFPFMGVITSGSTVTGVYFERTMNNVVMGTPTKIAVLKFCISEDKAVSIYDAEMPIVPTPTSSDYGKVLSATADGLVWVEQETLPDGEEMTF